MSDQEIGIRKRSHLHKRRSEHISAIYEPENEVKGVCDRGKIEIEFNSAN